MKVVENFVGKGDCEMLLLDSQNGLNAPDSLNPSEVSDRDVVLSLHSSNTGLKESSVYGIR